MSPAVEAQTRYVKDIISITFRTGPGGGHKVLENLESGQRLRLLKVEKGWANVRLPDGESGWVLNQYLTADKPYRLQLEDMKRKYDALVKKAEELAEENNGLKAGLEKIGGELNKSREAYESLDTSYNELQRESTTENVLSLREKNKALNQECERLREKAENIRIDLINLIKEDFRQFAIVGAGILFVGILIGVKEKGRRRKTYL